MKPKTRKHLTVAAACAALDHWAHEHNIALAVRTNDPKVRAHTVAQPGFWEHIARPGAASRKGSEKLKGRTNARASVLIAAVRTRAGTLASVSGYWTAHGVLNLSAVLDKLADELAAAQNISDLPPALCKYAAEVRKRAEYNRENDKKAEPKRNLRRAFREWLKGASPTWPTRDEALRSGDASQDPRALYRHTVAQRRARAEAATGV